MAKTSGKTAYIHFKMIKYMIVRCPFIDQNRNGDVYEVSENFTSIDDNWLPTAPIVAFLDANSPPFKPQSFLEHPLVQLLAASSPTGTSQPYMNQFAEDGLMVYYAMAFGRPASS